MTKQEALEELRDLDGIYNTQTTNAINTAIKSLEAWDKMIDYIQKRIEETKQDMEEDTDNTDWYLGYWQGLDEAELTVTTHLKEVEL